MRFNFEVFIYQICLSNVCLSTLICIGRYKQTLLPVLITPLSHQHHQSPPSPSPVTTSTTQIKMCTTNKESHVKITEKYINRAVEFYLPENVDCLIKCSLSSILSTVSSSPLTIWSTATCLSTAKIPPKITTFSIQKQSVAFEFGIGCVIPVQGHISISNFVS